MGNKVNPLGFRLGIIKEPSARWYASFKDYPKFLGEDELIRKLINKEVGHSGIERISIERAAQNIGVTVRTAKPGVVIGRGGETIKNLRNQLEKEISGSTVALNVQEVPNPNTSGQLIARKVADQLERRFQFRRAMQQAIQRAMESGAQGCKIRCSGRLNGAEQARAELFSDGRVPLQTIRANIDYGVAEAATVYGIIGVKAWVFHGEVVGDKQRSAATISSKRKDDNKRNKRRRPQRRRGSGGGFQSRNSANKKSTNKTRGQN